MPDNEIGFGKNTTETFSLFPLSKPILTLEERKNAILEDKNKNFKVVKNNDINGKKPWYELGFFSGVKENESIIEHESKQAGVNPDLVKAIVYLETTHGYYDRLYTTFDVNKTIRPMNVHTTYWKDLGYSREELQNPRNNIKAGVKLLKRIQKNMPNATEEEIASVYKDLDARQVNTYGKRVKQLMKERPWAEN